MPEKREDPIDIEARGDRFYWAFSSAGADGVLGTHDDITHGDKLMLTVGQPVRIHVRSNDYIYSFRSKALGINEVAVPDLTFTVEFTPQTSGRFALPVDPLCGFNTLHDNTVMGELRIQPKA